MRNEVVRDLQKSTCDLMRVVLPALRKECKELQGTFLIVEGNRSLVHEYLDLLAGIDVLQVSPHSIRGIATRVQFDGVDHQTFTVRELRVSGVPTEFEKRLYALQHRHDGCLYPQWTVQAYMSAPGGVLLSVAVVKTIELYQYIIERERSGNPLHRKKAGNGMERFIVVNWMHYQQTGRFIFVHSVHNTEKRAWTA